MHWPDSRRRAQGGTTAITLAWVTLLVLLASLALTPVNASAAAPGTLTLVGQLPLPNPLVRNSEVWGWVDPNTNKEYAVVGKWPGNPGDVFIIDVSVPTSPVIVHTLVGVPSFDMKTWIDGTKVYLYLCDGDLSGADSHVWDVTDPTNPVWKNYFDTCHNIYIDSNGYMYLSYTTLRIYELNTDPANPTFVWSDGRPGGHDAYVDENTNRLYDFHGWDGTWIYDISMLPAPPDSIGVIPDSLGIMYHHSGWTSANGKYLYVNDELGDETTADITVWNVAYPAIPTLVMEYHDSAATVHNTFRVGNYLHTSYYVAGYRVFDCGAGATLNLVDEYDTSPGFTGNKVFEGCWGVYPFQPSGNIYASDMQNGFFVFNFTPGVVTGVPNGAVSGSRLRQNYPNPFNPTTTITYDLTSTSNVRLTVFDALGRKIRALFHGTQPAGTQSAQWDARDDEGKTVASGVYFYRLEVEGWVETKRMILLK